MRVFEIWVLRRVFGPRERKQTNRKLEKIK
jgi:hypothetical protein